ncbi:hypothetical protein DRQ15_10075 [candidate division KSB1 bacterium]|nr:MAG: hypothetical protein DRQ15_10075 [candidate division KSB1 bacterium]
MSAQNLFVMLQGQQVGPVSKRELQQWVRQRKVKPSDLVWDELQGVWQPISESEETRNIFLQSQTAEKIVLAIGGGKGGVGKTVITIALGMALASFGRRTVLVDADLGGANLHTFLGIEDPEYTFFDFYTMQKSSLNDILLDTSLENLKFISGACGTLGLANPKYSQKLHLIRQLKQIDADYILLDLGAGSSYNVIDFFLAAGEGIVISTPEPASIQETFYFIKTALLRKLTQTFHRHPELSSIFDVHGYFNDREATFSIKELYKKVENIDNDAASVFQGILRKFQPKLILNMVMQSEEALEGMALKTAVGEMLMLEMDYWGFIEYDEDVRNAAMQKKPFMIWNPKSRAAKRISQIVSAKLMNFSRLKSYLENKRLQRNLNRLNAKVEPISQETIICSVNCLYWDECEYQNGGYPCSVRHLENTLRHWEK